MSKRLLFCLLFLCGTFKHVLGQAPVPPPTPDPDPTVKNTKQIYLYRLLNWCIVGRGEYGFSEWPISQFKPILHQTHKNEQQYLKDVQSRIDEVTGQTNLDPWSKYDLHISPISCTELTGKGLGDGSGNFLHRVHIQFKPKSATDLIAFQGLLIQAVHAPFGLGFPFGVFDTDHEFTCSDCKHFHFSKIIGCLSRPDYSPMHPTVALYHFKLRGLANTAAAAPGPAPPPPPPGPPGPAPAPAPGPVIAEWGYQSELHWNFKWANLACSSSRLVEFWVLMVLDFERRAWTVKKFGPYDLNDFAYSSKLETPKTLKDGGVDEIQPGLPTPIIPDCHPFKLNPLVILLDPANPLDPKKGRPHVCFRRYKIYDPKQCERWERKVRLDATAATPPPPPAPTAKPFDLFKNLMICDAGATVPTPLAKKTRVRVVGEFDVQCTRHFPGDLYEKMYSKARRQPGKICPEWQGRVQCEGKNEDFLFDINAAKEEGALDIDRAFPGSHCITCKPVTEEVTEPPSEEEPFFKRAEHGVFMIFAFFFFNPVSLNVARFYKETLHEKQYKGWRLWLVIHVGFAAFASMFSYIGYTYPSFQEWDYHITLGYGAMIGVSSGVITGWFRHKNPVMQNCMFYLHALSGYLGWGLAIASFVFAPLISKWTRLVSYGASGICLAAMAIMTFHICQVDSSIGVRPKRSHIPIIEIRFDDIVPPKGKFRKFFLWFYIFLQFVICFGMLVL